MPGKGPSEVMGDLTVLAIGFVFAAVVSMFAMPVAARIATAVGMVAPARPDRWGSRPTPLLGGTVIVIALVAASASLVTEARPYVAVAGATVAAALLGLLDDARGLRPASKLVGQGVIGAALAAAGVRVEIIDFAPIAFAATVLWVVLIMNAINLMDNMDGLAAGVTAISCIVLILMAPAGSWVAVLAAATAGSAAGFLVHNFAPARIYMGDAGSLPLGVVLASLTLALTNQAATSVGLAVLAPIVAVGLPIFDTALVTIVRRMEGRPISRGGRDHTSHRLAALGLSERVTVLFLYAVSAALGALGIVAQALGLALVPIAGLAVISLVLFAVFLIENPVAATLEGLPGRASMIGAGRSFIRYGAEITLDATLATIALLSANILRFESFGPDVYLPLFIAEFPVVVPLQLVAFALFGVYRILWRYVAVVDLFVIFRATAIGTVLAAVFVLGVLQQPGQSRGAFIIDGLLLALFVAISRMFLASLRHWFRLQSRKEGRRVLIVGANETGAVALRLLLRSADPKYQPAGFLDDDPAKQRRRIGGIPVVGRIQDLATAARRQNAEVVVLALEDGLEREDSVRRECEALGLELRQVAPYL